jgi:hypothetical protein
MSDKNKLPSAEELKEFISTAETAATEALQNGNEESAAKLFNEIQWDWPYSRSEQPVEYC